LYLAALWIRIGFNWDPDQAMKDNIDPDQVLDPSSDPVLDPNPNPVIDPNTDPTIG
jgi:hypothetical protein